MKEIKNPLITQFKDGMKFSCLIGGLPVEGAITIYSGHILLCQNEFDDMILVPRQGRKGYGGVYDYLKHAANILNMILYDVDPVEDNKKFAEKAKKLFSNEYFPLAITDILDGDYVVLSQDGNTFIPGRIKIEKHRGIYLNGVGLYENIRDHFDLKHSNQSGYHFFHEKFDTGIKDIAEAKCGSWVYNISTDRYHKILDIVSDDGSKIFYCKDCKIDSRFASATELSKQEKEDLVKYVIEHDENFKYLKSVQPFEVEGKDFLNTGTCFFNIGHMVGSMFSVSKSIFNQQAWNQARTSEDLEVFIPVEFLNYFGYYEDDIIRYVDLLNQIFKQKVYHYKGARASRDFKPSDVQFIMKQGKSYRLINNNFYVVHIQGSKWIMHTYLRFILLHYIYNDDYKNIPYFFFKIVNGLGDKIDLWKALLLSNSMKNYSHETNIFRFNNSHTVVDLEENDLDKVLQNLMYNGDGHLYTNFEYCDSPNTQLFREQLLNGEYVRALRTINFDIL